MGMSTHGKRARRITAAEAAGLVKSGDWVDYGAVLAQPDVFDRALAARKSELRDVKIRACLSTRPRAVLEVDPQREHFQWYNWHFGGYDRKKHDAGLCHYIPCNLGEISDYYRRFIDPPDILVLKTREVDANGFFNLSVSNLWHRAIASRAKIVVVEVSEGLPYVYGVDNGLHISEVDYVIEGDPGLPPELPNPPPCDADRAVAKLIAAEVEDGACLQVGIGAMPNAVCSLLLESGVRNLGIHTEMLTDGLIDLYKGGSITGSAKTLDPGKIVFSFAFGSQELYRSVDRNPDFLCCPVEYTNLPHISCRTIASWRSTIRLKWICRVRPLPNRAATATSAAPADSCNSSEVRTHRTGGKSFICLSSTYERHGIRKSRIALELTPGNVVTTPRSDMMYVVTEFGMVNLKGKSVPERAKAMISIAHPDFRDGLEREAREHGLIPRRLA